MPVRRLNRVIERLLVAINERQQRLPFVDLSIGRPTAELSRRTLRVAVNDQNLSAK